MEFDNFISYQDILLQQVYLQGIQQSNESIKTWTQYKSQHEKIIEGLKTLSAELSLNCMVPLGKRALMKGKLQHTNEILVCIGDGYFVKYSAQQAIALCNRRIKRSEEMLKKLEQERNLFEMRQIIPADAFESDECKDINEHWDDKKIENWRVEHRKKEKEYRQKLIELRNQEKIEIVTEDDLFKRLDQLELEEELADELARLKQDNPNFYEEDTESETDEENEGNESEEAKDDTEEKEIRPSEESKTELNEIHVEVEQIHPQVVDLSEKKVDTIHIQDEKNVSDLENKTQKSNVSEVVNSKDTKEVEKPVKQPYKPIKRDTKINGKFEVSIISEEEVEKMLGRSNSSLNAEQNKKNPYKNLEKTKINLSADSVSNDLCSEKAKDLNRRVSFAPFVQFNENSDSDEDMDDDPIIIEFKHSNTESPIEEGTENDITSPRDIYRIYCKPKSILKRSLDSCYRNVPLIDYDFQEEKEIIENENTTNPVYNLVVQDVQERNVENIVTEPSETNSKKKRVSRFKLERANIKKDNT